MVCKAAQSKWSHIVLQRSPMSVCSPATCVLCVCVICLCYVCVLYVCVMCLLCVCYVCCVLRMCYVCFIYVCVMCLCYVYVGSTCAHAYGGHRLAFPSLSKSFPTLLFETESLLRHGAHQLNICLANVLWAASVSAPLLPWARDHRCMLPCPAFYMGGGVSIQVFTNGIISLAPFLLFLYQSPGTAQRLPLNKIQELQMLCM